MLFNSPEFIAFFLFVYGCYLLLPFRLQNYALLLASYVFYGWWDIRFLFLIALSTTVDYWVGLTMDRGWLTREQKLIPSLFLVISAVVLLGLDWPSNPAEIQIAIAKLFQSPLLVWSLLGSIRCIFNSATARRGE
jgi:alginate O-acetyltransferase complex protein AlgI